MPKSLAETYSLIDAPITSNSNHQRTSMNNDNSKSKYVETYSPDRNPTTRVRFLEPSSASNTSPTQSHFTKRIPSSDSFEASSAENMSDLYQDGPNSISRGLQTDISNASVIDWVLGQKTSSTGDRYIKT